MLTPQEVSTHSFSKASFGGYNMAMVDEFLDELTDDYTALYKENAALKAKLKVLVEKVEEYRATEDSMRATLLTAQKMADSIVHEAEAKRDQMLEEARSGAQERISQYGSELEAAQERLRQGQQELAEFIRASRELCERELRFLEQLPQAEVPAAAPEAEPPVEGSNTPILTTFSPLSAVPLSPPPQAHSANTMTRASSRAIAFFIVFPPIISSPGAVRSARTNVLQMNMTALYYLFARNAISISQNIHIKISNTLRTLPVTARTGSHASRRRSGAPLWQGSRARRDRAHPPSGQIFLRLRPAGSVRRPAS